MSRLKWRIGSLLIIFALLESVMGRFINNTIYDTNLGHVTYEPRDDFCIGWMKSWEFWRTCEVWAEPWKSEAYYSQGQWMGVHRSLNHQLASVTVKFEGSAIWLYGPPRAQLSAIPPDYKICMRETHSMAPGETCYRVNVAEAYSDAGRYDEPVVIFAKGGLRRQAHQVVISVGDPIDNTRAHLGIHFSHAVYTTERPTPWPVEEDHWRFRRVVMHDTHPLLSYNPTPRNPWCGGAWCRGNGWTPKTYQTEDGEVVSWHDLRSGQEWDKDQWGVEATITAGSMAIYGIPKTHITDTDYLGQICVRINSGRCEIVDVQHAYLNAKDNHESVMLWQNNALDSSVKAKVEIRLVKTESSGTSVFAFKSIEYYEPQEYSSPSRNIGKSESVEVVHDNEQIVYHPGRRCLSYSAGWCTEWFDPWAWREEGPADSRLTYRSTMWSYRTAEDPSVEMDFQGSAVYVYGAPKMFVKGSFASQHVCLNGICHIVDVEQAYLNAPPGMKQQSRKQHTANSRYIGVDEQRKQETGDNVTVSNVYSEYDPVLIWSMAGLDDQVPHRLRLSLAALPSEESAEMSIAKVVYTKVTYEPGRSRPDPPKPQPDPRYEGPAYPPYAQQWVPHRPLPALPSPSRPPPPPIHTFTPPPSTHLPPAQNPGSPSTGIVIIVVVLTVVSISLFGFYVFISAYNRREEKQKLIDHDSPPPYPPPPYSPPLHAGPNSPARRDHILPYATNRPTPRPSNISNSTHTSTTGSSGINRRNMGNLISETTNQSSNTPRRPEENNIGPAPGHNLTVLAEALAQQRSLNRPASRSARTARLTSSGARPHAENHAGIPSSHNTVTTSGYPRGGATHTISGAPASNNNGSTGWHVDPPSAPAANVRARGGAQASNDGGRSHDSGAGNHLDRNRSEHQMGSGEGSAGRGQRRQNKN